MPDRREPRWPFSRHVIRKTLRWSGIPALDRPTDITILAESAVYEWARLEVPFSRLSVEKLPMEVDEKTSLYLSDEARLARQIVRAFVEPISDMSIVRRGQWHYIVTFTMYTNLPAGRATYEARRAKHKVPWSEWVRDYS